MFYMLFHKYVSFASFWAHLQWKLHKIRLLASSLIFTRPHGGIQELPESFT
jgi:hypothetical protein